MNRGDVVTVALPGDLGRPRPAVIVQTDILNEHLRTILLCPITSYSSDPCFFRVSVQPTPENGLWLPSEVMVEKLQAANRSKIGKIIGRFDDRSMRKVAQSLVISLGLAESEGR